MSAPTGLTPPSPQRVAALLQERHQGRQPHSRHDALLFFPRNSPFLLSVLIHRNAGGRRIDRASLEQALFLFRLSAPLLDIDEDQEQDTDNEEGENR